jgi:hypothetical protein
MPSATTYDVTSGTQPGTAALEVRTPHCRHTLPMTVEGLTDLIAAAQAKLAEIAN